MPGTRHREAHWPGKLPGPVGREASRDPGSGEGEPPGPLGGPGSGQPPTHNFALPAAAWGSPEWGSASQPPQGHCRCGLAHAGGHHKHPQGQAPSLGAPQIQRRTAAPPCWTALWQSDELKG